MAIKTKDPGLFNNFTRNIQDGAKKSIVGAAALTAGFGLPNEVEQVSPVTNVKQLHAAEFKAEEKLPYTVGEVINALVDDQIITFEEGKVLEPKLRNLLRAIIPPNADYTQRDLPGLLYRDLMRAQEKGIISSNEAKFLLTQESMASVSDLLSNLKKYYVEHNRDVAQAKTHFKTELVPKYFNVKLASIQ